MSIPATTDFLADFKTGYLQRAIILHQCAVTGGADVAYDGTTGYAVGRLVKITLNADGLPVIAPAGTEQAPVSATSISDATHIIAQSDDTLRNVITDAIPVEKYTTRARGILANTFTATEDVPAPVTANINHWKSVAVYKIVNADDVKIIPVLPSTGGVKR